MSERVCQFMVQFNFSKTNDFSVAAKKERTTSNFRSWRSKSFERQVELELVVRQRSGYTLCRAATPTSNIKFLSGNALLTLTRHKQVHQFRGASDIAIITAKKIYSQAATLGGFSMNLLENFISQQMKRQSFVLSGGKAREIYGLKVLASNSASVQDPQGRPEEISNCTLLAAKYGVSSKTIRDIWNRKTWVSATDHLIVQELVSPIDHSCFECLDLQVRIA